MKALIHFILSLLPFHLIIHISYITAAFLEEHDSCVHKGRLTGTYDDTTNTYVLSQGHLLWNSSKALLSSFGSGVHFVFFGDSNTRFTVIGLVQLLDPEGMRVGARNRWNATTNNYPHISFIDVALGGLSGNDVIYSSTTKAMQDDVSFSIRVTFYWAPLPLDVINLVPTFLNQKSKEKTYLYMSVGLWTFAVPGSPPASLIDIDKIFRDYCQDLKIVADACYAHNASCVVGLLPSFNGIGGEILANATKSQIYHCQKHSCPLKKFNLTFLDTRAQMKAFNTEQIGFHWSHVVGLVIYQQILLTWLFSDTSALEPKNTYGIRYSPACSHKFVQSMDHSEQINVKKVGPIRTHNDWVSRFCTFQLISN